MTDVKRGVSGDELVLSLTYHYYSQQRGHRTQGPPDHTPSESIPLVHHTFTLVRRRPRERRRGEADTMIRRVKDGVETFSGGEKNSISKREHGGMMV